MTRVTAALVLIAAVLTPAAPDAAERPLMHTVLANGVTVLVHENAAAGVVAVSLLVRAGSRYETAEQAGITNFLHRVMLRGTAGRSAVELAAAAEDIGGALDASGDVEYAEIRGTALAARWPVLLDLIADVVLHPALPAEAVQTERRLVLSQIQTRLDTPFPLTLDTLLAELYHGHGYALPAVGLRPSVERISRDDLLAHYRAIYRPDRMVLAVSGRVPAPAVLGAAGKLFGALPAAAPREPSPTPDIAPTGGRRILERPAQQAQIVMGFIAPSVTDPDYAAAKVLGAVLGGGMAGRLFVELREKQGLAYSLGMMSPSRGGPSFLVGYMGTAPTSADAAEHGMLHEIARIRAEPPTADEVARAKAYLLGTQAMDRRTNARQAWYLGYFALIGAGYDFPDRYGALVERVTPADVQAAARRYLERPTIVILRPR